MYKVTFFLTLLASTQLSALTTQLTYSDNSSQNQFTVPIENKEASCKKPRQGPTGPQGPIGPTGPGGGGVLSSAAFTAQIEDPLFVFSDTLPIHFNIIDTNIGGFTVDSLGIVTIPQTGTYLVTFGVTCQDVTRVQLFANGSPVSGGVPVGGILACPGCTLIQTISSPSPPVQGTITVLFTGNSGDTLGVFALVPGNQLLYRFPFPGLNALAYISIVRVI